MRIQSVQRKASSATTVAKVTVTFDAHTVNCVSYVQIWTNNSGSPGSQIGNDSDNTTVTSAAAFDYTWTGAQPDVTGVDFWMVLRYVSGNVNVDYENGTKDAGVIGGDFEASATVTNLVSATTVMPHMIFELSDTSTGGQSTNDGSAGFDFDACVGLLIDNTP